jgi:hypothetical protein
VDLGQGYLLGRPASMPQPPRRLDVFGAAIACATEQAARITKRRTPSRRTTAASTAD